MAIYTQSPLMPDIKGKIGGLSISTSQSNKVIKVSSKSSAHRSLQATTAKSSLKYLQENWRNLTSAQREAWQTYSNFRPVEQKRNAGKFINGHQYYLKYNSALYSQFATIQNTVAFTLDTPFTDTLNVERSGGNLFINSTQNIDETTDFCLFKISGVMSASRSMPPGGLKQIILTFGNTTQVDIASEYLALYGRLPAAGETVMINYIFFKNGVIQWSAPSTIKLVVV